MARHNRDGRGFDQRGYEYAISYQPDWLQLIKVTRTLESGRQSTKTLFRNPSRREQSPGRKVRTRVSSAEQDVDFEIAVNDPGGVIKRVIVETEAPQLPKDEARVVFTLDDSMPPPPNG